MYNVGIIGFGKMGMLHGALLEGTRKAKISAICDKSLVMRWGFKRVYKNVNIYSDAKKMLEKQKLDIVIVTTPTFNHYESIQLAVKQGCAVFVEKPLAINSKQAADICNLAQRKNALVQVGFCNRFLPSFARMKRFLQEDVLGQVNHIDAVMYIADVFEEHSGWRYNPQLSGGGVLMDFGIHMIDLLVYCFSHVESVESNVRKIYSSNVEDEVSAKIQFQSGVSCDFETSWSKKEYRKSYSRMEIKGSKGSMIVTDQTLDIYDLNGEKQKSYAYPQLYTGTFMDIGGSLFSEQMQCFLERISCDDFNKGEGCTPEQALYVQRVVEAIYQSNLEKSKVQIRG